MPENCGINGWSLWELWIWILVQQIFAEIGLCWIIFIFVSNIAHCKSRIISVYQCLGINKLSILFKSLKESICIFIPHYVFILSEMSILILCTKLS